MRWLSTVSSLLLALGAVTQATAAGAGPGRVNPLRGGGSLRGLALDKTAHNVDVGTMTRRAAAYPQPLSGTTNVRIRDPTIIFDAVNKQYIVAGTGNKIPYWTAPSLSGPWKQSGTVLSKASIIGGPGSKAPWAPDVHYQNGLYYLYYTVSTIHSHESTIGVATSSTGSPGSFKDLGEMFSSNNYTKPNALDPSYVEDGHLVYGSYFGGIYLTQLQDDLTSVANSSLPGTHLAGGYPNNNPVEGSNIYKKNGWYYLIVSEGQCCGFDTNNPPAYNTTEYKVRVGRSRDIQGPYVGKDGRPMTQGGGTVILNSFGNYYAPGGQSVYYDPNTSRDIMVFHYSDPSDVNAYATMGIYYLDFSSGWPKVTNH